MPMRCISATLAGWRWPQFFTELVLIIQRHEYDTETAYGTA